MLAVDLPAAGLSWHRTLEEQGDLEEVERKVSPTLAAGIPAGTPEWAMWCC